MHKLTCLFSLGAICTSPPSYKCPQRLHLSLQWGHVTLFSGFLVLIAVNWQEYPMMPFSWCEPLYDLMFTKLAWLRSPYWCDTASATSVVVIVGDSTHLPPIPLAMLTMKKKGLGFLISMRGFRLFLQFLWGFAPQPFVPVKLRYYNKDAEYKKCYLTCTLVKKGIKNL